MPAEARATEAGRALVEDAARRVKRIDMAEKFAVMPRDGSSCRCLPAMAALMVALFVSPAAVPKQAAANATTAAQQQQQVKKSVEVLRRNLEERKQAVGEGGPERRRCHLQEARRGRPRNWPSRLIARRRWSSSTI